MLTTLMLSSAFALECDAQDIPCNTANALVALVNDQRSGSMGDGLNGKRSTGFVRNKLEELLPAAAQSGCVPEGISAVRVSSGNITGAWADIDLISQTPTGIGGPYAGNLTGNGQFAGTWATVPSGPAGTFGNYGKYHFPTGKLASLRDPGNQGQGMLVGGIARINSRNAVAWAIHGSCPDTVDVAAAFAPYMPQLGNFITPECEFDVSATSGSAAIEGDCACVDAVCDSDSFCCDVEFDSLCVSGAEQFPVCDVDNGPTDPPDDPFTCAFDVTVDQSPDSGTPGDCLCVDSVCLQDPFCCGTAWDQVCANAAATICF